MSDEQQPVPEIAPMPNGPYRVTNLTTLQGLYGAQAHQTPEVAKLCRCGGSKNKPFCDGSHRTNGFSDAKAPKENVVGDVNDGWRVANVLLGFERGHGATTDAVRFRDEFDRVSAVAQQRGLTSDPLMRQDLARAHSTVEIMKWMGQRQVTSVLAGNTPGPESSLHKLIWSEYHTWFTEMTMHILGADAMTPWVQTMLGARPGTIYAGTSEVQRNIVGDRVLGLPREPRADSGPWNEIGKN